MSTNFIQNIKLITITIINVILLPFFLLLICGPSYIYRALICSLAKILHQDLGPILSVISGLFASTNIENNPMLNIILNIKVNGKLNFIEICDKIKNNLIFAKNQHGKLIYPQFQMYPVQWMGYYFWKNVNIFELGNHISIIKLENGLKMDLEFEKSFGKKTFKNGESPWKFLFIRSEDDTYYHILIKLHHCMADGYSIFTSFMKCADNPIQPYIPKYNLPMDGNILERIRKLLIFPFCVCYDFAKLIMTVEKSKSFLLKKNINESLLEPNTILIAKSKRIKLAYIKEVSVKLGFPVSVIIMGGISGGIHHFLHRRGMNSLSLTCMTPLPIPNRQSDKLTNKFVYTIHPLPIEEMEPLTRMEICEYLINELKLSRQAKLPTILLELFGAIPFLSLSSSYSNIDIGFSTFPGPRETMFIDGQPVIEMSHFLYGSGGSDAVFSLLTYDKDFVFIITGATHAFNDESDLQLLMKDIQDEFEAFKDLYV